MGNLFLDTETVSLHSMPVLIQYAYDDGDIHLYDIWKHTVGETLDLIEEFLKHTLIGFNLSFDVFQLAKLYTIFRLCPCDWIPEEHVNAIAAKEVEGQEGPAIKFANCLDLLLHSRKTEFQSLMARSDIRIRRVPTPLAYALAEELEQRVEIDGIYFARRHDKDAPKWQVFDIVKKDGSINPDLKDVVLRFAPAGGLKFLAEHALKLAPKYHYADIEIDRQHYAIDLGYAPFATAVSSEKKGWAVYKRDSKGELYVRGYAWPGVIHHHIKHWAQNAAAREYARLDIEYTRGLYEYFDRPPAGDNDSVLACMVPVVRWRGFKIDLPGIKKLYRQARATVANSPVNVNKPPAVRRYLGECMDDMEALVVAKSTKKANLILVSEWTIDERKICSKCDGVGCTRCEETGEVMPGEHPAAKRAKELLSIKFAAKEVELYKKLLRARKFHASFRVIGTLSSRMSGADGLNAQGIKSTKDVRGMFPLAPAGYALCGGDFDTFEIVLSDAVYNDPDLRKALLSGKKIHAMFGMCLHPGTSYEEVLASAGSSNDLYTKGKVAVFSRLYGGDKHTLVHNLGVPLEVASKACATWDEWFPQSAKSREKTFTDFCSMSQPDGTNVIWREPADYCETFLGFRRYFTLENRVCRVLYDLAKNPPKAWRGCKIKVVRSQTKGVQAATGAVASALYGAAFGIQAANQRAAANHLIQSPGGMITKAVQRKIWDLQPCGVYELVVAPVNVHDEILSVTRPEYVDDVARVVQASVESFRSQVPLIGMKWNLEMASWAEKKGGSKTLHITYNKDQL